MEIVIGVAAKVAAYTVGPILRPIGHHIVRPIAHPFINLWEYKSNLENLNKEVQKLEEKRESVQGLTNVGVEPLPDVKAWQDKVTNFINEVSGLTSEDNPEQQSMKCCKGCTYSNLKECYQRRNNVARKLKDVAQLFQEAMKSTNLWEYKSNLENLKKEVEKLDARRESVQRLIKDGEEPLQHVKLWQENVNKSIAEVSRLINPQQQNMQCCNGLICSDLDICYQRRNNVGRMLEGVALLLQEARDFREVSTISEEAVYRSNLDKLKKDVETLKLKRESVQCLIKVGEAPLPNVKVWQDRVKKIIDEVPGLTIEHNAEHQNKVAQMLKEIAQLLQEAAQFREVSCPSIPEQTCLQPSIQPEFSESRMSILKDIIAALTKADVNVVGIYGMGGVGKTTLAMKVGSQAMQDKLFDKIVFVEVSQSPDIRTIQGVIADHVGLQFEGETVPGRASKLCDYLKKEKKKILIILDNLWKEIKLEEDVGIPFGNNCKELKLLLTARSCDVLTKGMDSQNNFYVGVLNDAQSWILFKSIAGTRVAESRLNTTANEIVKKCGGLPLAIVTVAHTLKNIEAEELWTNALQRLNKPSPEGFESVVYNSIKLSYDSLDKELREIFLLCIRMGRTYDASIQELLRYGLGLGYFDKFDKFVTVEGALCNVYASVKQLKDASLLLHAPETDAIPGYYIPTLAWERFSIHDVVCDVVRSIASKDQHVFTVINGHVPRSLTNEKTLRNCTSITLYNIEELSKDLELECPNIKFLYVKPKRSDLTIPDNFFIGMSSLQVLHLIEIDLKPLPSSLSRLVNLQALCLDHCELGDVVAIGDMNKLEVLSFRASTIQMLPEQLRQLTTLRLLDLTDCSKLSVIPSKVMSSLTGIEALYMNDTSIKWKDARPSIDELKQLRRLTTLEMHIPESKMFRGLISSELKRYNICIGDVSHYWKDPKPYSNISRRFLRLQLDTKEDWIIWQFPWVEELQLEGDVVGAVNLLDDLDRNGFRRLMYLRVSANDHCVCIVNSVSCAVLPSLESLTVRLMGSLEKICNSPLGADSFLNLKTIRVENCNKLSNIFCFFSIVRVLPNLKDLTVSYCENVEEVFAIEEQDDGNSTEVVHDIKFSQLSYLTLLNLPKLKSFCRKAKTASPLQLASYASASQISSAKELNNHSSLFNEKVVTPNLQDLSVDMIPQIEQIWHSLLSSLSSCVQNLTKLRVQQCDNLKVLVSSSMAISEESRGKERRDTIVFPKLTDLWMTDLMKLTGLCSGYNIEFSSLEEFDIGSCPQLKEFIFDETVATPNLQDLSFDTIPQIEQIWHGLLSPLSSCVQNLTELRVCRCDNLKVLVSSSTAILEESRGKEGRDTIVFPKLNCLWIEDLRKLTGLCSGYNIKFPSLKEFRIIHCHQLEEFIFDETVATPNLQDLNFDTIAQIEQIWHGLLSPLSSCVQNLTELRVYRCDNLKALVSSSTAISEESRGKEGRNTIVFPKLNFLWMEDLTKLIGLCSGYNIEFSSLKKFIIKSCPQLKEFIFDETVATPNLQDLSVNSIPQIEQIWHGLLLPLSSCVQNLTKLRVYRCDNLKELVSSSTAIWVESRGIERRDTIVFPKLNCLWIEDLRKLTGLCSGYNIKFPSLKEFRIIHCHQLEEFIFDETVATPNLQDLSFDTIAQIEQIWHGLLSPLSSCVQNLTELRVYRCDNLKALVSSSTTISEESRGKEGRDTIVFPKLNFLWMKDLTKLTGLCSGYNIEFPSLKKFIITSCPQLKEFIFDETVATPNLQDLSFDTIPQIEQIWHGLLSPLSSCVQNLTGLRVYTCDNLKALVSSSTAISEELRGKEGRDTIVFPKLNFLWMGDLTKLTGLCSGYNIEFPSLKEFRIIHCHQLKEFIFDETVKVPKLEELRIVDLNNLKMIWHNKCTEDSFSKLKSLEVTMCHKLLTVFPSNMCGRLLSLESLNVDDCYSLVQPCVIQGINSEWYEHVPFMNLHELTVVGCPSLKYIFAKEGTAAKEVPAKFVFPKLTSMKLKHLPKLGTFYPGKHTVEGPIVKRLELYDCGIHYTDEEDQTQQPLYLVQQLVFPCLEELELTGKQLTMMGQVQVPEYLFHKLKILNVREHESTVFPPGIIQRCQNLEKLLVTGPTFFYGDDQTQAGSHKETFFYGEYQTQAGSCKEIFFCGEDQTQAAPLAKVKTLVLQHLQDMKYMWEQDSIWDVIFQNLEVLTVDTCNSLVNLMPPSASLQNLTILEVRSCNSLETIVTSSMAKSLMKLKTMRISHCPKITEVIQNPGEVTEKVIFSKLKTLELKEADNRTSFCSCNFTLEFPSLEKLKVHSCRNMKTFFQGDLTMPNLQKVRINEKTFRLRPDTNLNTIIQVHAERYSTEIDQGSSSSEDME